jgi:hypothetical protein
VDDTFDIFDDDNVAVCVDGIFCIDVDVDVDSLGDVFVDIDVDVLSLDDEEIFYDVLDDGSSIADSSLSVRTFILSISTISHLLIM